MSAVDRTGCCYVKILITGGSNGQLYSELLRTCPAEFTVVDKGPERFDITDAKAVNALVSANRPDCIINAAAYTAVDKAEEDQRSAFAVNDEAVGYLLEAAATVEAHLVHISTDFVFGSAHKGGLISPLLPDAPTDPVSVYGKSKLAGEQRLIEHYAQDSLIVRTAWVYSSFGNNFVKTMLRLMKERDEIGVIADQIGSPTWARGLASAIWSASNKRSTGIMHWTGAGIASWYDFAHAIMEEGLATGLLDEPIRINPLRTDQYPTPAARPSYSVLETSVTRADLELPAIHWRDELRNMLRELS